MNPRKAKDEKVKNAGISLEPKLIQRAKAYAKKIELGTISTLVRLLLLRELQVQEIAQWMEQGKRGPSIGFTPPPKPKKSKENPEENSGGLINPQNKIDGAVRKLSSALKKVTQFPLLSLIATFLAVLGISPDCHHHYGIVAISFEDDDDPLLCAEIYNEGKNL